LAANPLPMGSIKIEMTKEKLVARFNKKYPVGSVVFWRTTPHDEYKPMTVKFSAQLVNNQPVTWFVEKKTYCSIDPLFVNYRKK
jgi:hypothetical protein